MAEFFAWEAGILLWFQQSLRNPVLDPVVSFFTHAGDKGVLFIGLTLLLLLIPKTRKVGFAAALALLFSLLITNLGLKLLIQRPRPWVDFPFLTPLVVENDPNSFPSGHTSAAFAFALGAILAWPRRFKVPRWVPGVTCLLLALLMGLSRLYVGVHYPSDVAAGALVGALAGVLGWWISTLFLHLFSTRKHRSSR